MQVNRKVQIDFYFTISLWHTKELTMKRDGVGFILMIAINAAAYSRNCVSFYYYCWYNMVFIFVEIVAFKNIIANKHIHFVNYKWISHINYIVDFIHTSPTCIFSNCTTSWIIVYENPQLYLNMAFVILF